MTKTPAPPDMSDVDFLYAWTLDNNLKVIFRNDLAGKIAEDPFQGLLPKDQPVLKDYVLSGSTHESGIYLPFIAPKSRETLWFKWKVKKHQNFFQLFAINVTEIKNNELYLAQILDSIPDLILVKGEGSKIVWANRAFQEHYNLDRKQLNDLIDANFVEPDYTKQYIIDDKAVWDSGEPLLIECEPVVRHDGVVKKFQTLKTPVLGPDNKVIYTVGVSRDITEKIDNEEKSFTAAKMAAIGEMAGGMAHEINNPMAVIAGKVFLLRRVLNKEVEVNKEMVINYLDTIQHHVERISKVITTLRKLSVDDDYEDFHETNVNKLVTETLNLCETKIKEKGITLSMDVPKDLVVEARSIQLSQALLNLLTNATEAVEDSKEKWISIKAKTNSDNWIEIIVSDSGPGVPEEIQGKIMQPFFTTKDVGKGSGLGLSYALSVAKNHHGTLRVATEISYSCFILKIPLRQTRSV